MNVALVISSCIQLVPRQNYLDSKSLKIALQQASANNWCWICNQNWDIFAITLDKVVLQCTCNQKVFKFF